MNYKLLKTYLEEKVLKLATNVSGEEQTINGLQEEFSTNNSLTEDAELTKVLTRFYHSVAATITPQQEYYPLPDYEQLTNNYLTTNKSSLGKKSSNQIEEAIDDKYYQLLDKIIADFQASLPEEEETPDPEEFSQAVTNLTNQALAIESKIAKLISTANPPNTSDQGEYMKILKGILLKSAQGKKVLADIKA